MPDITYDVGRVSFVMKGAWNLATNYEKLDAVSYNGSLYIAKQDVPGGTAITNTTYWQLAAEKGDKGDTGGVDSVNGQQGDVWFPDSRQLISDGYTTDTDPFLMKGNDSDSDRFELAKKLGNTVCVNQLAVAPSGQTVAGVTFSRDADGKTSTISGTASETIYKQFNDSPMTIIGHKYYVDIDTTNTDIKLYNDSGGVDTNFQRQTIGTATAAKRWYYRLNSGATFNLTITPKIIDLTLWFGSNDRIPSDLLAHPENWGRYYAGSLAYNAGTLESADGTVLKSIGRNIFDKDTMVVTDKFINDSNGNANTLVGSICTDFIEVIPNTAYYIKTDATSGRWGAWYDADKNYVSGISGGQNKTAPANARYMRFTIKYGTSGDGNKDTFCVSLYYSGESGYDQYYPYTVLAEVDTGSEVLRSAGAVADEKTPDGTITRKVGVVDLGTLTWVYVSSRAFFQVSAAVPGVPVGGAGGKANAHCAKYAIVTNGEVASTDKSMAVGAYYASGCNIYVKDTSYGTDAAAFKTAMSGVILNYELATPTTEQGTAFEPLVVTVKNGVLSWTNTKGIPVGQESHWFENLRKRVEDRLPDPPSGDGTYRLTCTISGGVKTYSWEA